MDIKGSWVLSERGLYDTQTGKWLDKVIVDKEFYTRARFALAVQEEDFEGASRVAFRVKDGCYTVSVESFARGDFRDCYKYKKYCCECGGYFEEEEDSYSILCAGGCFGDYDFMESDDVTNFGFAREFDENIIEEIFKSVSAIWK